MASPFASRTQQTISLPDDAGQSITIQKLSGRDLDRAQYEHMAGIATGKGRGWAQRFDRLVRAGIATDADAAKVLADPLSGFDRLTLAQCGVKAWTYTTEKGEPLPVTPAAIADLDDEALEFVAEAVLRLTKPALFQTADDAEAAQKNG